MKIINIASGSSGNCYFVSDGFTSILIEAGICKPKVIWALGKKFKSVSGMLVSHQHEDHAGFIKHFALCGLPIYTGFETVKAFGVGTPVENLVQFEIGSLNIVPFFTEHDSPDSFGYVIASRETGEQLLFATDTYFIKYRFANLTHMLIECNFDREELSPDANDKHLERVFESHMSLQDLLIFLKANDLSKVEEIYLIHPSEDNLNHKKAKKEVEKLTGVPVYICLKNGGYYE